MCTGALMSGGRTDRWGLEQGFDVRFAPRGGRGPLTLSVSVTGTPRPRVIRGGVLLGGSEGHWLRYHGLTATDAHGRALRSSLRLERGRLVIQLGSSIAISGETIVAGAPGHKVANNDQQGAAYVFAKPSGMVSVETQSAELTASDGGASDQLGSSIAISGGTVVAGAPSHLVGRSRQGAAYVFVQPAGAFPRTARRPRS